MFIEDCRIPDLLTKPNTPSVTAPLGSQTTFCIDSIGMAGSGTTIWEEYFAR